MELFYNNCCLRGGSSKLKKCACVCVGGGGGGGGGGEWGVGQDPNSGKRSRKTAFERSFQCFYHKSFVKLSRKRGTAIPPTPPLNPRMCLDIYIHGV